MPYLSVWCKVTYKIYIEMLLMISILSDDDNNKDMSKHREK